MMTRLHQEHTQFTFLLIEPFYCHIKIKNLRNFCKSTSCPNGTWAGSKVIEIRNLFISQLCEAVNFKPGLKNKRTKQWKAERKTIEHPCHGRPSCSEHESNSPKSMLKLCQAVLMYSQFLSISIMFSNTYASFFLISRH